MADTNPPRDRRPQAPREDARFRLLRALDGDPALSQRRLAQEIGVSLGAVNGLLNTLIETGMVKIRNAEPGPGRFGFAYVLTGKGKAAKARLAGPFLARRRAEREALRREIEGLEAELGRTPGPRV